MAKLIEKADENGTQDHPGTWRRLNLSGQAKCTAIVFCPDCGGGARLAHNIDPVGVVTPSMVCPHDGCDFHKYIVLVGWGD